MNIYGATAIVGLMALALGNADVLAQGQHDCGPLENAYGPYDYTNATHFEEKLPIVENAHFDVGVEQLKGHQRKPNGAASLDEDLDYTLRAFPNHHRALNSMLRYYTDKVPRGAPRLRYSADCYFDRAHRLAPDDAVPYLLEGIYMQKLGEPSLARSAYERAVALAPNSAEVHYNAGLMYAELEDYELAVEHALKAYDLGYPLQGLRNKLRRAGVWPADEEATGGGPGS